MKVEEPPRVIVPASKPLFTTSRTTEASQSLAAAPIPSSRFLSIDSIRGSASGYRSDSGFASGSADVEDVRTIHFLII
jgi:hypothetical protein